MSKVLEFKQTATKRNPQIDYYLKTIEEIHDENIIRAFREQKNLDTAFILGVYIGAFCSGVVTIIMLYIFRG